VRQQLADIEQQGASVKAQLDRARGAETELRDARTRAAAVALDEQQMEALRALTGEIRDREVHLAAAATRLQYALEPGRYIDVAGERREGQGELQLVDATTVRIDGVGELRIVPSDTDLAELRREHADLQDRLDAQLQRMGLDSLAAGELRWREFGQREREVAQAETALRTLAPSGLAPLEAELTRLTARWNDASATAAKLTTPADAAPTVSVVDAERDEEAQRALSDAARTAAHEADLASGRAQAALEAAAMAQRVAEEALRSPSRAERIAKLRNDLADARAEQQQLAGGLAAREQEIAQARPEILRQDCERYGRSADQHDHNYRQLQIRVAQMEADLQGLGALGLDERRAHVDQQLTLARRRAGEIERRARALDFLLTQLREKRLSLTRRLQTPLQRHLNGYLQLLHPNASLDIDEHLQPGRLTRPGDENGTGAFDDLSFGSREQVAMICRLAYADIIREGGGPTLLLLDDALVHSDEMRLAQMKRILFDAATRHQVLLFSCHPSLWRDLGVLPRAISEMVTS
jgi:hypothetical protein